MRSGATVGGTNTSSAASASACGKGSSRTWLGLQWSGSGLGSGSGLRLEQLAHVIARAVGLQVGQRGETVRGEELRVA